MHRWMVYVSAWRRVDGVGCTDDVSVVQRRRRPITVRRRRRVAPSPGEQCTTTTTTTTTTRCRRYRHIQRCQRRKISSCAFRFRRRRRSCKQSFVVNFILFMPILSLGSLTIARRTSDGEVAGSTPDRLGAMKTEITPLTSVAQQLEWDRAVDCRPFSYLYLYFL